MRKKSLTNTTAWYIAAALIGHLYLVLTLPIISTSLTKGDLSAYFLILQFVLVLQMGVMSLFGSPIIRFRPRVSLKNQSALLFHTFAGVLAVHLVISFIIFLYVEDNGAPIVFRAADISSKVIILVVGWSLLLAWRSTILTFLKSLEKPTYVFIVKTVFSLVIIALVLTRLTDDVPPERGSKLSILFECLMLAELVAFIVSLLFIKGHLRPAYNLSLSREAVGYALPLLPGSILLSVTLSVDIFIASAFLSTTELAYYGVASSLGKGFGVMVNGLASAYSPRLVAVFEEYKYQRFSISASKMADQNSLFLSLAVICCSVASADFFTILFRSGFSGLEQRQMALIFTLICLSLVLKGTYQFQVNVMLLRFRSALVLKLSALLASVTAVGAFIGVKLIGPMGLPIGLFSAYFVCNFVAKACNEGFVRIQALSVYSVVALSLSLSWVLFRLSADYLSAGSWYSIIISGVFLVVAWACVIAPRFLKT